jgi:hypothetical protein
VILIAHRGNLFGRVPERENTPEYLNEAIHLGYHVMVDAWYHEGCFWFGERKPIWKPHLDWLPYASNSVLLRARNPEALLAAAEQGLNVFWHQTDSYALTSWGDLLGFYGAPSSGNSFVYVIPERDQPVDDSYREELAGYEGSGLCSDHVGTLVAYLSEKTEIV